MLNEYGGLSNPARSCATSENDSLYFMLLVEMKNILSTGMLQDFLYISCYSIGSKLVLAASGVVIITALA